MDSSKDRSLPPSEKGSRERNRDSNHDDEEDRKPRARTVAAVPENKDDKMIRYQSSTPPPKHAAADDHSVGSLSTSTPFNGITIYASSPPSPQTQKNVVKKESSVMAEILTPSTERHEVYTELILFSSTAVASVGFFLYVVFPASALAAMMIFLSALYFLFTNSLPRALRYEYQRLLTGRGIGDYLPQSLFRMLTQQSIHEWLTQESSGPSMEYQHFLLYFLPLSNEQRNMYLNRLPAHQREQLLRPGIGNLLFGPTGMRLLLGEERYPSTPVAPRIEEVVSANSSTHGEMSGTEITTAQTSSSFTASVDDSLSPDQTMVHYEEDGEWFWEALWGSVQSSVLTPVMDSVSSFTGNYLLRPATNALVRYGGMSSILLGGWSTLRWYGYGRTGRALLLLPRSVRRSERQADHAIWAMAAMTGASAIVGLGLQWYYFGTATATQEEENKKKKASSSSQK